MSSSPAKPELKSRLLHLSLPDGSQSGLVILLGPANQQVGGIFDTKDPDSLASLQRAFDDAYRTPAERREYLNSLLDREYHENASTARRIKSSEYNGPVWYKTGTFVSVDVFKDYCKVLNIPLPKWVFAAKGTPMPRLDAEALWLYITESTDEARDFVPGSDVILNEALKEFYETNKDRLVSYHRLPNLIIDLTE